MQETWRQRFSLVGKITSSIDVFMCHAAYLERPCFALLRKWRATNTHWNKMRFLRYPVTSDFTLTRHDMVTKTSSFKRRIWHWPRADCLLTFCGGRPAFRWKSYDVLRPTFGNYIRRYVIIREKTCYNNNIK